MARKLPVYILIDTSGSMSGRPIEIVKEGIGMLVQGLREDPRTLETAWLSVVTFGGEAKQIVPLTRIGEFEYPELTTGGEAKLGAALKLVCECREREVQKTTQKSRGDYLPIVFLFSDGMVSSSDSDLPGAIATFKSRKWKTIFCTVGDTPADQIIKQIADLELSRIPNGDWFSSHFMPRAKPIDFSEILPGDPNYKSIESFQRH